MKLIKKTTVREYYEREVGELMAKYPVEAEAAVCAAQNKLCPSKGDEIWEYNDIGILAGSRGICVVESGNVTRTFTIFRS